MEGFCRGCLIRYDEPMELLHYTEKNRRLFVYSTGLQVKRNDTITFQLCKDCFLNMKSACKFKKQCRASDKKLKSFLTLKDVGEGVDFCTFLKNSDDTMTFRFPMIGSSTPANQKSRDDDNDSTCTSIRNFMTDILQGEEMPDTEARIIREVIEEEADVLDDSLDSHWLQDDASIDTNFRLDFSFSPFATPHSVENDHCYTPRRNPDQKYFTSISPARHCANDFTDVIKNNLGEKELCIFGTDEIDNANTEEPTTNVELPMIEDNPTLNALDMPFIGDKAIDNLGLLNTDEENNLKSLDMPILDGGKVINNLDLPILDSTKTIPELNLEEINDKSMSLDLPSLGSQQSINALDLPSIENDQLSNSFDLPSIDNEPPINDVGFPIIEETKTINEVVLPNVYNQKSVSDRKSIGDLPSIENDQSINDLDLSIFNTGKSMNNLEFPVIDENKNQTVNIQALNLPDDGPKYISTCKEIERLINSKVNSHNLEKPCTIDKNLEKALQDENKTEYSLDDLLVSPQVFPGASAASTPTITNILFGEKLELNGKSPKITKHKYVKKMHEMKPEIFEEFFESDTEEFRSDGKKIEEHVDDKVAEIDDVKVDRKSGAQVDRKDSEEVDRKDDTKVDGKEDKNVDTEHEFKVPMDVDELEKNLTIRQCYDSEGQFDYENAFCYLCKKQYKSTKALSIHFAKLHKIKIVTPRSYKFRPKVCNLCGAEFRDSQNFHRHLKRHKEGPKTFKCEICALEFTMKPKLDKHMSSHSANVTKKIPGKYVCNICGATSTTIGNLRVHERRHEKNYTDKCETCGKGFYRRSDLTVHMRLHTGEKPYPCQHCELSFARRDALTQHVKCHIDDRPFECEHCHSKYRMLSQLRMHIEKSKRCRQNRGINNKLEVEEENNDSMVIETTGVVINEPLPYIDTEMSN